MMPVLLLAVASMLCTAAALIIRGGAQAKLRARVRSAGARPTTTTPSVAHPNIRAVQRSQSPFLRRVLQRVAYNPDNPAAHSIPWPLVLLAGILVGLLGYSRASSYFGPMIGAAGGLASAFLTIRNLFIWQSRRYTGALFRQLPDALGVISRGVRAGLPMTEALRSVAREMPSPTREAFGRIVGEIAIGRSADTALWALYERTRLAEYAFFSVMIGLQAQTGGSLTGSLDTLADMVRKRVAMRSRARALAAEARMSAIILGVLPFIAALGLSFLQPGYLDIFMNTSKGHSMLMTALTFLGMGILAIRWLIRKNTSE